MSFRDTVNLPKTDFPMRGNLPKREPERIKWWKEIDIYKKLMEKRKNNPEYILHDGPPYANGHIHVGTAFNKVLKDFVIKSKSMAGYKTPYIPGWDCHGMPIEHKVTEQLGEKARELPKMEIRKKCREYAEKFVSIQKEEFPRLGVFGDWDNPYLTMDKDYEGDIIGVFNDMVKRGYIYKGLRPIHWCSKCETALAEAEVEYKDEVSPSIFVKLKIEGEENTYIIIWTTTPWTLPANVAVAVHPDEEYVYLKQGEEQWIMALPLVEINKEKLNLTGEIVKKLKGSELEGKVYFHPIFEDKKGSVVLADYVTMDTGSGCVHTAPGHGYEDYQTGLKYNLPIVSPVDKQGKFTDEVPQWKGMHVFEANKHIVEFLKEKGILLSYEEFSHSYPHCWRCESPLIFRATSQWFLKVDHNNLREEAKDAIENKVQWIPAWSKDRIGNMVESRPDWCLSRQRSWGVPIPALVCKKCGHSFLDEKVIENVEKKIREEGSDVWFYTDVSEFINEDTACPKCGGKEFEKEEDIFDVWFDASVSFRAVVERREELKFPSDMYLEAVDQHRGWFQVSLISGIASGDGVPYKSVLTHGLILDEERKKMSKKLGNVINPMDVINKYGADILRLWFSSVDYTSDMAFGMTSLKSVVDIYRKIRNTYRYLLGNLDGFSKDKMLPYDELLPVDKYILHRLYVTSEKIKKAYEQFAFYKVFHLYHNFCVIDLSQFYFDILKDRMYILSVDSKERLSAQTVMYHLLDGLLRLFAPILPFTTEEAYQYAPFKEEESIHLLEFAQTEKEWFNEELSGEWERLLKIRDVVLVALEEARNKDMIGKSLEGHVLIDAGKENDLLKKYENYLKEIFIVSQVTIGESSGDIVIERDDIKVGVKFADGKKCERCWMYSTSVGNNEKGLQVCDRCYKVIGGSYE